MRVTASCSAWFTLSGVSPPPSARNDCRVANTASMSSVRSVSRVTYSSPRSRYETRPILTSGAGERATIALAIDQIFCFAPSMRPPMEPVESSTKATSTRGRAAAALAMVTEAAMASAATTTRMRIPRLLMVLAPPDS